MIVKGATTVVASMSDEPDEVEEADAAVVETDEDATATEEPAADDEGATGSDDAEADSDGDGSRDEGDADEDTAEEADEVEAEEEAEEEDAEGLQEGDFIRIAYTARTVENGTLVDTTHEEVAEEEGVADQGTFQPRVIVLGQGHLFTSVEEDIVGKEVGDGGTVVVSAEEAFGEYDEGQVRTVSADKIDDDDRYPGAHVQIDGEHGVLETIIGGRARVDFNHPLAGEEIEYDYEIVDVVEDDVDRAEGLLDMFIDVDLEMWVQTDEVEETRVVEPDEDDEADDGEEADDGDEADEPAEPETVTETVEKRTLYVESTPQLAMNQQWMMQKQQIAQQVVDLTGVDRIVVQEILEGMGGMGGMFGGMGGGGDLEELLEEADIDADEIAEDL